MRKTSGFLSLLFASALVLIADRPAQAIPFTHSNNFNFGVGPDDSLYGTAVVEAGFLKLTNAGVNSVFGTQAHSLGSVVTFDSFSASWRSLLGGGTGGGADGYSFNVADDLPAVPGYADPGEEGGGTGLSVTVDTWDNGGSEVGIEIRWNGAVVAFMQVPKDDDGSGNFLRRSAFVNALLTVSPAGLATFNYDGNVINALLPGYNGITADKFMFGARTGGANDNQWIDDLNINAVIRDTVGAAAPEPATLLLVGAAGLLAAARRQRRSPIE